MRRILAIVICVFLGSCHATSGGAGHSRIATLDYEWRTPKSHPALVEGAWVRMRVIKNISPPTWDEFVGADGRAKLVDTWDDLRPLLRPVTDGQGALALLDLVQRVEVRGPDDLRRIQASFPLRFQPTQPEDDFPYEAFRPSDATRWKIPAETSTNVTARGVEVRRPVWRRLREDETEASPIPPGQTYGFMQPGVVEYVQDEVTRDGAVHRRILRVLESSSTARKYGPIPRL